ncbi:immunity 22 family protein [Paenibacillus guangzhouensis]|uniref:immunity 22 family protein n=1 Tax=Paenibacillus guangzhouensis TaxID=1473112 RepID=UPI001266B9E8|nr:immunity 22 family protein [Paenibacillus guangzhouensis]
MQHLVTIWGANLNSEEELEAFVGTVYDDDGDAQPSAFLASTGCSSIDEDFLEIHFVQHEEDRLAFVSYLRQDYSADESFYEHLPTSIGETLRAYNSIILVYSNDSPYGSMNEELFQITALPEDGAAILLASVVYET